MADDLTGAMDTGVQFARGGLYTVVMLDEGDPPEVEMVVLSTDSRNESAAEAYRRAGEAAGRMAGRTLYKKVDSTLRGNLGPEIEGLLDGLGIRRALVAPAFPGTGRTTAGGFHRVHGVLLAETDFARDPFWPATESHLPSLLARQTRRAVGHLPLEVVEQGVEAVARALAADPSPLVAADAVELHHLRTLAAALTLMEEPWLPVGSAGLAGEWLGDARTGRGDGETGRRVSPSPRPVLVVSGSRHPATARQLERAAAEGELALVHLAAGGDWEPEVMEKALPLLERGRNVALATTFSEYREGTGTAAAETLARAAVAVLERCPVAGLMATGGDVARAVGRALGAVALRALGEVQAGVAAGVLVGGPWNGLRVVTKAGGFGDERAVLQSIERLRGEPL